MSLVSFKVFSFLLCVFTVTCLCLNLFWGKVFRFVPLFQSEFPCLLLVWKILRCYFFEYFLLFPLAFIIHFLNLLAQLFINIFILGFRCLFLCAVIHHLVHSSLSSCTIMFFDSFINFHLLFLSKSSI